MAATEDLSVKNFYFHRADLVHSCLGKIGSQVFPVIDGHLLDLWFQEEEEARFSYSKCFN